LATVNYGTTLREPVDPWRSILPRVPPWMARPSVVTCQIARASDVEVVAAYELAEAIGESVALSEITRLGIIIASMLTGLIR